MTMQIPNLPTDNLYKFMSITGLIVVIISISSFIYSYTNLMTEIIDCDYKIHIQNIENEYSRNDIAQIKSIIEEDFISIEEKEKYKFEQNDSNGISLLLCDYFINSPSVKDSNFKVITTIIKESFKKRIEIKKSIANLEYLQNQINFKFKLLKLHGLVSSIFFGIGISLSFAGFKLWYLKSQKYQDKAIRNETK